MLILGLTGDLVAIGITQREIAEINKEAGVAMASAKSAAGSAKYAQDSARIVGEQATKLEGTVSTLSAELSKSEKAELEQRVRVVALEKQLEWRHLSPEQAKTIRDALPPLSPGVKIRVSYVMGDAEGSSYAEEVAAVLHDSRWVSNAESAVGGNAGARVPPPGVVVELSFPVSLLPKNQKQPIVLSGDSVNIANAAARLSNVLKVAGLDVPDTTVHFSFRGQEPEIEVFVGVKPRPSVGKSNKTNAKR